MNVPGIQLFKKLTVPYGMVFRSSNPEKHIPQIHEQKKDENGRDNSPLRAFLVGGIIGAAVALLYAPKSGRETRKDISKTARRIKKETVHLVEDAVDSINDFTGEVRDKVTDVIERGKDISEGAKKEIIRNLEHGQ